MTWEYTEELGERIADLLTEGNSLRQIEALEDMPSKSTMLRWLKKYEDFDTKCARARRIQGELAADEHKDVIDEVRAGTLTPEIARVVLSGLEWRAKKLEPKKYGDKIETKNEHVHTLASMIAESQKE